MTSNSPERQPSGRNKTKQNKLEQFPCAITGSACTLLGSIGLDKRFKLSVVLREEIELTSLCTRYCRWGQQTRNYLTVQGRTDLGCVCKRFKLSHLGGNGSIPSNLSWLERTDRLAFTYLRRLSPEARGWSEIETVPPVMECRDFAPEMQRHFLLLKNKPMWASRSSWKP